MPLMNELTDTSPLDYDLIVIGAGPAGCEAALAAARAGARTLCLTINLDNVGFPPANPIIAAGQNDPRHELLKELEALNGSLPSLLAREEIGRMLPGGTLLADRRNLGLAYKELLETTEAVFPRQSLVTGIEATGDGWQVDTRLGERFVAPGVVIAAGTFLGGIVEEAGSESEGGRRGEIPANSLAKSLQNLDIELVRIEAVNMPRLAAGTLPLEEDAFESGEYSFFPDGSQLGEQYMHGPYISGSQEEQLDAIRSHAGLAGAWMTRAAYRVTSLSLAAGQVGSDLRVAGRPGLFIAGRTAGSCNYAEAAATGAVAGRGAAAAESGAVPPLINEYRIVSRLCEAIAHQDTRPVTIRIEGPGC